MISPGASEGGYTASGTAPMQGSLGDSLVLAESREPQRWAGETRQLGNWTSQGKGQGVKRRWEEKRKGALGNRKL